MSYYFCSWTCFTTSAHRHVFLPPHRTSPRITRVPRTPFRPAPFPPEVDVGATRSQRDWRFIGHPSAPFPPRRLRNCSWTAWVWEIRRLGAKFGVWGGQAWLGQYLPPRQGRTRRGWIVGQLGLTGPSRPMGDRGRRWTIRWASHASGMRLWGLKSPCFCVRRR